MAVLTLYTREGCPLCVEMHRAADVALQGNDHRIETVDIDADADLKERYDWRVPVLAAGDTIICEGHFDAEALHDFLEH